MNWRKALRIIHVSDPHVAHCAAWQRRPLERFLARWLPRPAANLIKGSLAGHDPAALAYFRVSAQEALAADDWEENHLVVTGDLTTWGDAPTLAFALQAWRDEATTLGVQGPHVIYGNHDVWLDDFPLFVPAQALDQHRTALHTVPPFQCVSPVSAAAIWLNMYYLNFQDSAGGNINHAKLMLTKTSYNSTTGAFVFELAADLTANSAPSNTTFRFGAWFTIVVGDNTDVKAAQKLANNFTGSGSSGQCDSSAACTDSTTYTSVGTTGAPFRRMMLRGFDVGTLSANGLALTQIAFDVSSYTGTTSASGSTTCSLTASSVEDLDCQVGLSTFSFAAAHLTDQQMTDTQTGANGSGYASVYETSSSGSAASSFVYGLQKAELTPASSMTFKAMSIGYGALYFSSTPGTGSVSGQVSWDLERPSTPSIYYDTDQTAFLGFLY